MLLAELASHRAGQDLLICRTISRKQQSRLNHGGCSLNSWDAYRELSRAVASQCQLDDTDSAFAVSYRRILLVSRIFNGFTAATVSELKISLDVLHGYLTMSEPHACRRGFIVVRGIVERHDA